MKDETRAALLRQLEAARLELHHCAPFIGSREKMHPDGIALFNELLDKLDADYGPAPSSTHELAE